VLVVGAMLWRSRGRGCLRRAQNNLVVATLGFRVARKIFAIYVEVSRGDEKDLQRKCLTLTESM
jgi:hypothetical protein